jgi:hypothetical protein
MAPREPNAIAQDDLGTVEQLLGAMNQIVTKLNEGAQVEDPMVIQPGQMWATTEQLARRYGVTNKWVAARTRELGAAPISDASNSKLRYHLLTADRYMESRMRNEPPEARLDRRARIGKSRGPQRSGRIEFV